MKISKIILSIFAVLMLNSTYAQEGFSIKGRLSLADEGSIVTIEYFNGEKTKIDSAKVQNGTFLFTGKVSEPTKAIMTLKSSDDDGTISIVKLMTSDKQEFFLENVPIQVYGQKMKTALILGGSAQNDFLRLQYLQAPYQVKMEPYSNKVMNYMIEHFNTLPPDSLTKPLKDLNREIQKVQYDFVTSFPDSYVSLNIVTSSSIAIVDANLTENFFKKLSPRMQNTPFGQELFGRIEIAKKIKIGEPAIEIAQKNTNDKEIALKSLRGKYVLIDFWASWCGPCRQKNHELVKIYQQFKDKNFEIYAVSLDQDKTAWLKAIKDDGLPWIHVSELNGWKNSAALNYGIRAIPQNFLVGPDGKIVAINITEEQLIKALLKFLGS